MALAGPEQGGPLTAFVQVISVDALHQVHKSPVRPPLATVARMSPFFARRKCQHPLPPRQPSLEDCIDELMDRVTKAGDDHAERAAVLEEYVALARAHPGEDFELYSWGEDLADSYLALGRAEDAVRIVRDVTRWGYTEDTDMLCELLEKLMRAGHEPQARSLAEQAYADFPDDVWVPVTAGLEYGDRGDHATALTWLTTGTERALRTGDPESALEQLIPLRAASLAALGLGPDELQTRAAEHE